MLNVPQKFVKMMRFRGREELGYLIAHENKKTQNVVVTNMTKPTYGSFTKVSSDPLINESLNKFFASNPDFTVIPYHSHLIGSASEGDLCTFKELEKSGVVYHAIGTLTKTLFFRVFRGEVYPIRKYKIVTKPSDKMENLSIKIGAQIAALGVELYSL